jgi:2,4-dienoyl-CoA reductase-like NADH-dependent reductase (Old Yellow Enzyme family)/thioredoxin reductase
MEKIRRLFEKGEIGTMTLSNRIVMAPMVTNNGTWNGEVSDEMIDYYVARAKGGAGLIIVQATAIVPESKGTSDKWLNIYDDKYIPRLKLLSEAVQSHGARIAIQLWHGGVSIPLMGHPELGVGPSDVTFMGFPCRGLSLEEMDYIMEGYAEGARRAKESGFDAAEIHGGNMYLIADFLSPFTNKRTDEYGGSAENRARFACEIISRARDRVGADYPLLLRMAGRDYLEGGLTVEDAVKQAPLYVKAGIDCLHVRDGLGGSPLNVPGILIPLAEAVKKVVDVPVIAVQRIDTLLAEKVLQENKADFIAMGRGFLTDPEFPIKAKEGRLEDIRPCVACGQCANSIRNKDTFITCTVNAGTGREKKFVIAPAQRKKKVMVIGAGIAGLEAARVAALRGHEVTVYEKSPEAGGQWNIAALQPGKDAFVLFREYLLTALGKLGVALQYNCEITAERVTETGPDVIILATGAVPAAPDVPGIDGDNVVQGNDVITGKAEVGESAVVVGANYLGMELAIDLARKGKKVTLLEALDKIGPEVAPAQRMKLLKELETLNVEMLSNAPVTEITANGVQVNEKAYQGQTVVLATGATPVDGLAHEIRSLAPEFYAIGDCARPRRAVNAVHEGANTALKI